MMIAAHSSPFAKKVGIPQEVAKEFNEADEKKEKKPSRADRLYKKKVK